METHYTNLNLMSKKLYKIKYICNADFMAEEIVDAKDIDADKLDLKKHEFPGKNAIFKVYPDIKVSRKSIEDYDEESNNSGKKPPSNK